MSLLNSGPECPKCKCVGLHACVGRVLPPPTPEDIARLNKVMEEIFPKRFNKTGE